MKLLVGLAVGCGDGEAAAPEPGGPLDRWGVTSRDDAFPQPEVVAAGGLTVFERQLTVDGATGKVVLPITVETVPVMPTILAVQVTDLHGQVQAQTATRLALVAGTQEVSATLEAWKPPPQAEQANYLVHYTITSGGTRMVDGRVSLYGALPKVGLDLWTPEVLVTGQTSRVRVTVRRLGSNAVLPGVPVDINGQALVTGDNGSAAASITAGTTATHITVKAVVDGQEVSLERAVTVVPQGAPRVYVSTDKPLYRPGDTIHVRTLALTAGALTPIADGEVVFEVRDGKGTKVFREVGVTDAYGVAALTAPLAPQVNLGTYQVTATVAGVSTTRTVEVSEADLPKFAVTLALDQVSYAPDAVVTGTVRARYFFGTPVAGAKVTLRYGVPAVETLTGETDAEGVMPFELPGAGSDMPVHAEITDTAGFVVEKDTTARVELPGLLVDTAFERWGLPDVPPWRVFVTARTPRGEPAAATCTLQGQAFEVPASGVAVAWLATRQVQLLSCKNAGGQANVTVSPPVQSTGLLVRTQKTVLRPGEPLEVEVVGSGLGADPWVTVDCVHRGRIVDSRPLQLVDGRATTTFTVGAGDEGTLTVSASVITASDERLAAAKHAYVQRPPAWVSVSTPEATYRPGGEAVLNVQVTDASGAGRAAAVGLAIADEAVFALAGATGPSDVAQFFLGADAPAAAQPLVLATTISDAEQLRAERQLLVDGVGGSATWTVLGQQELLGQAMPPLYEAFRGVASEVAAGLQALANEGVLTPENAEAELALLELVDFWGQPVRVEVNVSQGWWEDVAYVALTSAGMNEVPGDTVDDLQASLQVVFPRQNQDAADATDGGWDTADASSAPGDWYDGSDGMGSADATDAMDSEGVEGGDGAAPAKPRSEFPETLYVNPSIITDGTGKAQVTIPLADAITAWRVQAIANTQDGLVGGANGAITVLQPFFVELDLPRRLTQGDRLTVPAGVFNFTDAPLDVTVTVATASWFALTGPASRVVTVAPGTSASVPLAIEVLLPGAHALEVSASAGAEQDAIIRTTTAIPNGKRVDQSVAGRLESGATLTVDFPPSAVAAGNDAALRLTGSSGSELLSGLEGLLQTPTGCFEPMMNTTWVNALVLQYLQQIGEAKPDLEAMARANLSSGMQQTVTFECDPGGFTWFGDPDPPHVVLTAFGLQMFADLAPFVDIDGGLRTRAVELLTSLQRDDGSFQTFEGTKNELLPWDELRTTCIVAWGLAADGSVPSEVAAALGYIQEHLSLEADSYTLAMCLNALMTADPGSADGEAILAQLVGRAEEDERGAWWTTSYPGLTQVMGDVATVETTAFVAQALFRLPLPPPLADKALSFLAHNKSPDGNFLTSQGTIQSLRAFVASAAQKSEATDATITVTVGGEVVGTHTIDASNRDVTHTFSLRERAQSGDFVAQVTVAGTGTINYQLTSTHYVPWGVTPRPRGPVLDVGMAWAPTTAPVGAPIVGTVTVTGNGTALGPGDMPMIQIPVPPGFDVDTSALDAQVGTRLARYETKDDHVLVYLHAVPAGTTEVFEAALTYRPRFAMTVTAPAAKTWPFYKPEQASMSPVETLTITP